MIDLCSLILVLSPGFELWRAILYLFLDIICGLQVWQAGTQPNLPRPAQKILFLFTILRHRQLPFGQTECSVMCLGWLLEIAWTGNHRITTRIGSKESVRWWWWNNEKRCGSWWLEQKRQNNDVNSRGQHHLAQPPQTTSNQFEFQSCKWQTANHFLTFPEIWPKLACFSEFWRVTNFQFWARQESWEKASFRGWCIWWYNWPEQSHQNHGFCHHFWIVVHESISRAIVTSTYISSS